MLDSSQIEAELQGLRSRLAAAEEELAVTSREPPREENASRLEDGNEAQRAIVLQALRQNEELREQVDFAQAEVCHMMHRLQVAESGSGKVKPFRMAAPGAGGRVMAAPPAKTLAQHVLGVAPDGISPSDKQAQAILASTAVASTSDEDARAKADRLLQILTKQYDTVVGTIDTMTAAIEKGKKDGK